MQCQDVSDNFEGQKMQRDRQRDTILKRASIGCLAVLLLAVGCQVDETQKKGKRR